jgi:hypothetical protein
MSVHPEKHRDYICALPCRRFFECTGKERRNGYRGPQQMHTVPPRIHRGCAKTCMSVDSRSTPYHRKYTGDERRRRCRWRDAPCTSGTHMFSPPQMLYLYWTMFTDTLFYTLSVSFGTAGCSTCLRFDALGSVSPRIRMVSIALPFILDKQGGTMLEIICQCLALEMRVCQLLFFRSCVN